MQGPKLRQCPLLGGAPTLKSPYNSATKLFALAATSHLTLTVLPESRRHTNPSPPAPPCSTAHAQIVGADMVWQQELETKLDGGVVSLSVLADSCELLAGTQEGSVYRLLLADLSASKVR